MHKRERKKKTRRKRKKKKIPKDTWDKIRVRVSMPMPYRNDIFIVLIGFYAVLCCMCDLRIVRTENCQNKTIDDVLFRINHLSEMN